MSNPGRYWPFPLAGLGTGNLVVVSVGNAVGIVVEAESVWVTLTVARERIVVSDERVVVYVISVVLNITVVTLSEVAVYVMTDWLV